MRVLEITLQEPAKRFRRALARFWPGRFHGLEESAARVRILAVSIAMLVPTFAGVDVARAVILYSSATRNTSAPVPSPSQDDKTSEGWNYEATWGGFLATPIDATHFLAAKHVGDQGASIIYQGNTYTVNESSGQEDPGSDLQVWSLQSGISGNVFPSYAPLYNASSTADGSLAGKTLTVIGRGTQRGDPVVVSGTTKGWYWGAGDGVQSWGQNVVSGLKGYNSVSATSLLYFNFDGSGVSQIANEGIVSVGDSSGAAFIFANGRWKLAGINYAVNTPWSFTGTTGDSFNAAIFDARGLYAPNGSGGWSLVPNTFFPVPAASYCSNISDRLSWIGSVAPMGGDANKDLRVDVNDLTIVLTNYNQTSQTWSAGDFNGDGAVDVNDLTIVLTNYGKTYGSESAGATTAAAVPEPSVAMLAAALLPSLVWSIGRRARKAERPVEGTP